MLACRRSLSCLRFHESVCDSRHKRHSDARRQARMECVCRDRNRLASTAPNCGNRNNRRRLCAWQIVCHEDRCGSRNTVLERHGNRHFSGWSQAPVAYGSPRRLRRGAHPTKEMPFSNGQTGLAPSRLLLCGRLRSPQPCRPDALLPFARGIAPCVDPRDNRCRNDLQTCISPA